MSLLQEYFGHEWSTVAAYDIDGQAYYVGYDVVRVLGLRSTTWAIRRKISRANWTMRFIEDINRGRAVYLVNLQGVLEIILYNNSQICNRIKPCIVTYLVHHGMDDFEFSSIRRTVLEEEIQAAQEQIENLTAQAA